MEQVASSHELIKWFSIVLFILSLFFLFFLLLRYKKNAIDTKFKLQLLAGVGILPLVTLFLSDQALLEGMKEDKFCGSCHIMVPFFKSLNDPEVKTLAAVHAQNRWIKEKHCYTCHTDYDILGGVKAKILGLRHLYAFYTAHGEKKPKLYKPYHNNNCLSCHKGARSYEEDPTHKEIASSIAKNEVSCLECHGPSHPQ